MADGWLPGVDWTCLLVDVGVALPGAAGITSKENRGIEDVLD